MDYSAHYQRLINRAKARVLDGYVEVHHILPRCLGGIDDKENLVQLTAEEHYVAHQLLCKIYPDEKKLAFALQFMTGGNLNQPERANNKLFGWIRRRFSKAQKGRIKSAKERRNISEAGKKRAPRKFSEQARLNMAESRRRTWRERKERGEHLLIAAKTKATRIKNGSYKFTDEHRSAISEGNRRRFQKLK